MPIINSIISSSNKTNIVASIEPNIKDPAFPINILAGLKLNSKKDNNDPITVILNNTISYFSFKIPNTVVPIKQIINNPLANPSNPSVKFTAFVVETYSNNINMKEKRGFW